MLKDLASEEKKGPQIPWDPKAIKDYTAFQIHQWIGKKRDLDGEDHVIGDWVTMERHYFRRGQHIGLNTQVQAPVWKKDLLH